MRDSLNLNLVSTLQTHKIANCKLQKKVFITCITTYQPRSTNKDGSNLGKPCFGCCFNHSFVNFKNLIIMIWNIGLFMVPEKVKEVLSLISKM